MQVLPSGFCNQVIRKIRIVANDGHAFIRQAIEYSGLAPGDIVQAANGFKMPRSDVGNDGNLGSDQRGSHVAGATRHFQQGKIRIKRDIGKIPGNATIGIDAVRCMKNLAGACQDMSKHVGCGRFP